MTLLQRKLLINSWRQSRKTRPRTDLIEKLQENRSNLVVIDDLEQVYNLVEESKENLQGQAFVQLRSLDAEETQSVLSNIFEATDGRACRFCFARLEYMGLFESQIDWLEARILSFLNVVDDRVSIIFENGSRLSVDLDSVQGDCTIVLWGNDFLDSVCPVIVDFVFESRNWEPASLSW